MGFPIAALGPDVLGVHWTLCAEPRHGEYVPSLETKGSASVRADLAAFVPYQPIEVRETWLSKLEEYLDQAFLLSSGKVDDHLIRKKECAVFAREMLRASIIAGRAVTP